METAERKMLLGKRYHTFHIKYIGKQSIQSSLWSSSVCGVLFCLFFCVFFWLALSQEQRHHLWITSIQTSVLLLVVVHWTQNVVITEYSYSWYLSEENKKRMKNVCCLLHWYFQDLWLLLIHILCLQKDRQIDRQINREIDEYNEHNFTSHFTASPLL